MGLDCSSTCLTCLPFCALQALVNEVRHHFKDENQSSMEGYGRDDLKQSDEALGPPGKLMCRYCDRRFRYPSQLKDHMQTHNGQRPYMCTECGMDFMKVSTQTHIHGQTDVFHIISRQHCSFTNFTLTYS